LIAASILDRDLDILPQDRIEANGSARFRPYLSFDEILETVDSHSVDEIVEMVSDELGIPAKALVEFPYEYCGRSMESCSYYDVLKDLKENIGLYDWVYDRLADNASRKVYTNLIYYRLLPVIDFINLAYDPKHPKYFDKDILQASKEEVFVDCGGYSGETAKSFIRHFGGYKKIYVYEPSGEFVRECRKNLAGYPNVDIRNACLGVGTHEIASLATERKNVRELPCGRKLGELSRIVSLDQDLAEPITFLKLDVRCATVGALKGARGHIVKDKPKMAVNACSVLSDIWEVPKTIHSIDSGFDFYIRHYERNFVWETVVYAVPSV
jgi:FkbM family methyltransferase